MQSMQGMLHGACTRLLRIGTLKRHAARTNPSLLDTATQLSQGVGRAADTLSFIPSHKSWGIVG